MINNCKELGCLFVPVGHPHSEEQHLLWRISPSHQERLLLTSFNSVQLQCYILLKLIKKEVIGRLIEGESLSSYHCKTCMLYIIENTPEDFWNPENLVVCLESSLRLLEDWTIKGVCPNYFMPAENMFERRIHGELRLELSKVLQMLVNGKCRYLCLIEDTEFGRAFRALVGCDSIQRVEHLLCEKRIRIKLEYLCGILV